MRYVKRLLSVLLTAAMLVSMVVLPAGAAEINEDFAANIEIRTDAVQFEGRDTLLVSLQAKTLNNKTIQNAQSVFLACDKDLFDVLATSNGITLDYTSYVTEELAQVPTVVESVGANWTAGYTSVAANQDYIYYGIQPTLTVSPPFTSALDTKGEFVSLATIRLAFKDGKDITDVATNSIRLITVAEAETLHQNAIAVIDDGTVQYNYGKCSGGVLTGDDTLAEPTFTYVGFTPAIPTYTGDDPDAPTVDTKKGGDVTLVAQDITGETVEYAYGTTNTAPTSGWQTSPSFTGLAAGEYYFFARVKETADHQASAAVVSAAVTVYAAPSISYAEIPAMTIDTAIASLSPEVTGGAGAAASDAYKITTGTLPAGLSINAETGVISGTPTTAGAAGQVTVTYTDAEGQTATAVVKYGAVNKMAGQLTIECPATVYGSEPEPNVITNTSGGNVTFTYSKTLDGTYGAWNTSNPVGDYYVKGTAAATDKYEETESNVVLFKVTPAAISGTVTISGNTAYGETLTANPSNIPGTLAYQWYRSGTAIDGATQSTYKLTTDDVGSTISVKVSDSAGNYSGTVDSTVTSTVTKATYSDSVTGAATVVSNTYDKNATTNYSWALSGLTGLPADIEGIGYENVTVTANADSLISGTPVVSGGNLQYVVAPKEKDKTATITVVVTSANYEDITATITVTSVDKQPANFTVTGATVTYDGAAHSLTPDWPSVGTGTTTKTVTYTKDGGSPVTEAPKDAGTYTVTATYENDTHYGTATATLTIEQLEAVLTWSGDTGLMYNGDAKNVTATVSNLVGNDSCTVTVENGNQINAGTYTATATALSNPNYKLPTETTREYTIAPKVTDLTVTVSPAEFEYDGSVKQPATITVKDGETVLTVTRDYTVFMEQSQKVGTYTVTVTGAGNYAGSTGTATYEITKVSQAAVSIGQIDAKTYGDADFTITVSGGSGEGAYSLTSSDPTILSLVKGEAAGEWTATIHKAGDVTLTAGKAEDDNYKPAAAVTMELEIQAKALVADEVTLEANYNPTYTGEAFTPSVTVKDGDKILVKDTDYEVAYKNNINAGTATVTVTGKGNYAGSVEKTFIINKASLSEMKPTIVGDAQVGGVLTAKLAGVAADQYTWTWYRDGAAIDGAAAASYVVTTEDSNKAITVKATAKADVNYSDATEISEAVTVAKQAITGTVVITETNGTGTAGTIDAGDTLTATATVTPAVTLGYQWFVDGQAVENATGKTFTVPEDSADKSITVTVAPTSEDYTGSVTSAAGVVGKAPLTGSVTLSQSNGKITAAVEGAPEAENYDIVWLRDGQPISGATGNEYTVTDADKGHTISAKLVAKGDTYTGEIVAASGVAVAAEKPNAPVVTASAGNGQITVSWTAQDNGSPITQYQVQLNSEAVITLDAATTSYTFTGLTNDTLYTVTVKAINAIGTSDAGTASATPKAPAGGGGGGGVSTPTYGSTVESTTNGTVTVSPKNASKGATVTITVTPDEGYVLDTITVTDKDGKTVEVTKTSDTKYTFQMPGSAVTVKATFAEKPDESKLPFTDVAESAWYYDAVVYVYENGMMTGTNDGTTFSPAMNLTRGMMAQVLYNIEQGTAGTAGTFTDVAAGAWYADAVNWAASKGIVNGYGDGTFGPEDSITREQMAVLLYNYAKYKGYDMTATTDLTAFSDDEQVSDWAEYAMQWAVAEKLIQGSNNALNPLGTASRAEVAQILANFGENVAK